MMRDDSPRFSSSVPLGIMGSPPPWVQPSASSPQGSVLRGRYGGPLRSAKGKIKGLWLHHPHGELAIKLPKELRPMLVRDLVPGSWVQVWAYQADDHWRGLNLMPWPETEVPPSLKDALAASRSSETPDLVQGGPSAKATKAPAKAACIQVCRKGKCFKQGGQQILHTLKTEVEANPDLQHIAVEGTGCMGACKQGPNLRVMPQKKMHSRVTPDRALALLSHCQ